MIESRRLSRGITALLIVCTVLIVVAPPAMAATSTWIQYNCSGAMKGNSTVSDVAYSYTSGSYCSAVNARHRYQSGGSHFYTAWAGASGGTYAYSQSLQTPELVSSQHTAYVS